MAAFRAAERDESAAQFGKEHADAAVEKMKARLEKLKAIQVPIHIAGSLKPLREQYGLPFRSDVMQ